MKVLCTGSDIRGSAGHKTARAWLQIQANLVLAPNTIDAYDR
jgi:hypothetical protein